MPSESEHAPEQHDHVDATGVEEKVDELEERVMGGTQDQVRHEDDDADDPAFDQDLEEASPRRGPAAEPDA